MIMEDYEKKYKEALEKTRALYNFTHVAEERRALEDIFPELRESEDERIRKAIINAIKEDMSIGTSTDKKLAIDWLERQGGRIDETFAWKIHNFVEKWKQGMYGAIDLQEALDTYTIEP